MIKVHYFLNFKSRRENVTEEEESDKPSKDLNVKLRVSCETNHCCTVEMAYKR